MGRIIGSVFLVAGTALGAGMLALPMVAAATGFWWAVLLLTFIWAVMTYTGLLVLEVNLAFPAYRNSFNTMAGETTGPAGRAVAWIACLVLLYSLTAAYIAGDGSLMAVALRKFTSLGFPNWLCSVAFTLLLGSVVFWSVSLVDLLNRIFFSLKGILLIFAIVFLMPHINIAYLVRPSGAHRYIWACIPIFICSFGYHTVIPSLSNYLGDKPQKLKWIIIVGATIPLIIYFLWLLTTMAIIPLLGSDSFYALARQHGSVGEYIQVLTNLTQSSWVVAGINGFSNVAMATSFLGVTLGLFDFLADAFRRMNSRIGRLQTALLTFIPPLVFAIIFPNGFILALGYAAIFVAILEIILPVFMVRNLRKKAELKSSYRVRGGKPLFVITALFGVLVIVSQLLNSFHLLPIL